MNKCLYIKGRECPQPTAVVLQCGYEIKPPCFPTKQDFINEYPDQSPEAVKAWLANHMNHQISMYERSK
jgi:hypothetical protein